MEPSSPPRSNTNELREARKFYFAAGGLESDIGPRDNPLWYWRRAAKLWRGHAFREAKRVARGRI